MNSRDDTPRPGEVETPRASQDVLENRGLCRYDGAASAGRDAITRAVQSFMTAFPDLVVKMDRVNKSGPAITYHWTLTGTDTGPGGTGNPVKISGFEEWKLGPDGLIAESKGHFDPEDYQRQLNSRTKQP